MQTFGDVGNAGALQRLLEEESPAPPQPRRTVLESLRDAEGQVSMALRGLPLPDNVQVVSAHSAMEEGTAPSLEVVYLSDRELGADAQQLLTRLIAAETRLDEDRVSLIWMRAIRELNVSRGGGLDSNAVAVLRDLRSALSAHPSLQVTLTLPDGLSANLGNSVASQVQEELGLSSLPPPETGGDRRTAIVRLRRPAFGWQK